jgi:uncharacterized protein (DUF433 family)
MVNVRYQADADLNQAILMEFSGENPTLTSKPPQQEARSCCYTFLMEQRIVINPEICGGRPVIAGTRITVQTILEFLGAGDSIDDILAEYPSLSRNDVLACLRYSSQLMGNHFTLEPVALLAKLK